MYLLQQWYALADEALEKTDAFGDAGYRGVANHEEAQGPHCTLRCSPTNDGNSATAGQLLQELADQGARPIQGPTPVSRHQVPVPAPEDPLPAMAKNHAQLLSLFAMANLVIAKRQLMTS